MKFIPHGYQEYCIKRILGEKRLGLMLDMGLGKTAVALSALHELMYNRFEVARALVIAPKKVAQGTWTHECEKWDRLRGMRVRVVMGTEKERLRALSSPADVYVINRDNVVWLVETLGRDWCFDTVIIDELSSFKNGASKRFRALKRMLPRIERLYGLTGTPAPNGLIDLWAQIYLLDGGARLGRTLTAYREAYFDYNPYRHEYALRTGAQEEIQKRISDICISMRAEDYLTLPECIVADVPVALSADARRAYRQLERDYILELPEGEEISAMSAAALTNKLLQLCNGAAYGVGSPAPVGYVAATGEDFSNPFRPSRFAPSPVAHEIHSCKLDALAEVVEGLQGQHALLFYSYRSDIARIKARLMKLDRRLRLRELQSPEDERDWNAGEIDILLAHPASCAYGLNLQEGGRHIIWFGLTWSLELYQQANKRLHRQGQTERVIVHRLIVQGGMDEAVARALEGKEDAQEALLTALRARIRGVRDEQTAAIAGAVD